ncbi:MAG: hypothetical protein HY921_04300 [Elusimicrobia bacterium]|nr:hypothetical protein [Elusimicrobiota bacterium]
MTNTELVAVLTDPFVSATQRFAAQVPSLVAALLLLLLGMFLARGLRTLVERFMHKARLDEHTARVGINEILARLGLGKSPSYVLGFLVYWFVLFIFIVAAANTVNMTVVSELLERFALFLPVLVASLLILFGGLLFARFLSEVVENAATANNIRGGKILSRASYAVVVLFSAMTALEQLGMKMSFVSAAIQILLGSMGLAAALAFGLGGKEVAAEIIRDLTRRKQP